MTLARKGSRRITVDGIPFHWKVRGKPSYSQANGWTPLIFVVEQAERPGALLVASLPCAHPGNWLDLPAGAVVPGMVASAIKQALTDGWQPSSPGPAFMLTLDESAVIAIP